MAATATDKRIPFHEWRRFNLIPGANEGCPHCAGTGAWRASESIRALEAMQLHKYRPERAVFPDALSSEKKGNRWFVDGMGCPSWPAALRQALENADVGP